MADWINNDSRIVTPGPTYRVQVATTTSNPAEAQALLDSPSPLGEPGAPGMVNCPGFPSLALCKGGIWKVQSFEAAPPWQGFTDQTAAWIMEATWIGDPTPVPPISQENTVTGGWLLSQNTLRYGMVQQMATGGQVDEGTWRWSLAVFGVGCALMGGALISMSRNARR